MRKILLTDIAGECPHPINKKATHVAQNWILNALIRAEYEAEKLSRANGAHILSDRTIFDVIPYSRYSYSVGGMTRKQLFEIESHVRNTVWTVLEPYDKIYWPQPREGKIDNNNPVRDLDKEYQLKIHSLFKDVIEEFKLNVEILW